MTVGSVLRRGVNVIPYGFRPWIKNIPGIAGLQRWLVDRVLSERAFVHTIDAGPAATLRFEITLPLDKAVWIGTYESDFVGAMLEHFSPGDICYDIGGHRGYISGVMALAGAARVFVFEPLPANRRALERLCELNPKLPIQVVNIALANTDGLASFTVMPESSMGKLAASTFQMEAKGAADMLIEVRRIDSLLEANAILPPDLVKIDVEGAELEVLLGALDTLRTSRPKIFLEAHTNALEKACTEQLSQLGYRVHRIEEEVGGEESTRHLVCLP